VDYTILETPLESAAPCAICGRARRGKHVLMPDPQALALSAPENLTVCDECAPEGWAPGWRVGDQEIADLRAEHGH